MRDGFWRASLKRLTLFCTSTDLWLTRKLRRLRGERPMELGGACQTCAACCEAPSIQVGRIVWFLPTARCLFLGWQRHVNGFELIERLPGRRVFVFRCTHFDPTTRRCDSYATRPIMCRDYPRNLLWQVSPEFLPGCGYKALDPGRDRFVEALKNEGFEGESLEALKKKLYLDDDE